MTRDEYEAKVWARIESMRARAAAKANEAASLERGAATMAAHIPLGQPILVGHYSEGRDRRYRERIHRTFQRAHEARQAAADLSRRAEAAEDNTAISSDDPAAVEKLTTKLAAMEREQRTYRGVNAAVRAARRKAEKSGEAWEPAAVAALVAIGIRESIAKTLCEPDFAGRIGVPDYKFANLSGNIRRVRDRIVALRHAAAAPERASETYGDVVLSEDKDSNRVQLRFAGKPSRETIAELKSSGFRWSPTAGVWQRQANNAAWYAAQQIARRLGRSADEAAVAHH